MLGCRKRAFIARRRRTNLYHSKISSLLDYTDTPYRSNETRTLVHPIDPDRRLNIPATKSPGFVDQNQLFWSAQIPQFAQRRRIASPMKPKSARGWVR